MSSSPSRAPAPAPMPAKRADSGTMPALEASPFAYSEAVLRPGQHNFLLRQQGVTRSADAGAPASGADDATREAQWRELGEKEGVESRRRFEEQLAKERATVARAVADFAGERAAYYQKLEQEAVRLALGIARKILHREAQMYPLLLMGIVKVALEKIENATEVALLVPPQRAAEWRKFLASSMEPENMPEIVEDPSTPMDQCSLRTSMGVADLGMETQLREIEKGFMDLLAARPPSKPADRI
jgi:flagellar biosynthesis/type III secretory pathway protein FliH